MSPDGCKNSIFNGKIPVDAQGSTEVVTDRIHPGARRAPVEPPEQSFKLFLGALGKYLHLPCMGILYPTGKTKPPGLIVGGIPKTHPLNPTLDQGEKRGRTWGIPNSHENKPSRISGLTQDF